MDNTRNGGAWRIINGNQIQCTQVGSSCYISTSDLNSDLRFRTNNTNNRLIIQSTGEIVPGTVGNKLGINTLPWDLTVGVATNAAAHFVTSGLTANRNITIPDNSFTISQVIASGTSSLGTSSISAGSCATAVTTSATGTTTADTISWTFNAAPGTGYKSGLYILAYVTAGNVNFLVCNPTFSSLTPASASLNWRVIR